MWARSLARTGHQTPNLRVPGSNPGGSAKLFPRKSLNKKSSQKTTFFAAENQNQNEFNFKFQQNSTFKFSIISKSIEIPSLIARRSEINFNILPDFFCKSVSFLNLLV